MSATKPPGQEQDPAPDKPLRQEDFITEDGVFDFEAATEAVERRNTARRQREKLLEGDPRRRFGRPREHRTAAGTSPARGRRCAIAPDGAFVRGVLGSNAPTESPLAKAGIVSGAAVLIETAGRIG